MKKKILSFLLAICLLIPCAFALTACGKDDGTDKTMSVSVNPAVSFVVDGNNKVVNVILDNADAGTIYANVNFSGMTAENAIKALIEKSVISGHFTLSGDTVTLEVNGSNAEDIAELENLAKAQIESVCDSLGVTVEVDVEELTETARKLALIESAKVLAPEKTEEELEAMTNEQLVDLIKEKQEALKGLVYSQVVEIQHAFSAAENAFLQTIQENREKIAECEALIEEKLAELENLPESMKEMINAAIETNRTLIANANAAIDTALANYAEAKQNAINTAKAQYETAKAALVEAYNEQVAAAKAEVIAHLDAQLADGDITQAQYDYWKSLVD